MGDTGVETAQEDIEIEIPVDGVETATVENNDENKDNTKKSSTRKDPEPCDKPDENAFKQAQEKITAELATVQKQIDAMTKDIDAACATRQKFRDEAKSAQDQLTAMLDIKAATREVIDATKEKYNELADARKEQRAKLEPIAQGLKFSSREALEAAILKIEARLAQDNLSTELRAKHLNDIALLKGQRMQTMRYEEQLKLVKKDLPDPDPLKETREAKLEESKGIGLTNKALYDKKKAAQAEANKWNKTIDEQIAKRKEVIERKNEINQRKNQLTKAYQTQERQYERYQQFLEFKKREAARMKRAEEREARIAAAKARAEERAERARASGIEVEEEQTSANWSGDGVYQGRSATRTASTSSATPTIKRTNYDAQLGVIADLKRYLEFYKPKDAGRTVDTSSQSAAPAVVPRREFNEKKTVALLTKKKDIDDEWGSVIGTSKAAKVQREAPKPKKVKDTPVNHIPEALAKFKFVGVSPPLLSSQIDTVLKALEEQKHHYETLPDKEYAEALKKLEEAKEAKTEAVAEAADKEELEEGEIAADEGDEEESAADLSAQQTKAVAVTKEVLKSDAMEDLTTAFAAATIAQVDKVVDAIAQADDKAIAAPEEGEAEEEEMTPEQAAAMAAMADELGEVVEEAQAGLGDWVPPVADKKPEHKEEKPTEKSVEKPAEKPSEKPAEEPKTETQPQGEEEEEEMTPEQAAAMAAMADELGEVVEEAQAGLGDWVPPVAEKKPENKEKEQPAEHKTVPAYKTETLPEHKLEELAAESKAYEAAGEAAGEEEEEELTPEQAAAMAAMADELGEVVEEAQAGLGDWVPNVAEKKHEAPVALAEITQQVQDTVVAAVAKAVDAAAAGPVPAITTPAMEEEAEEQEDEGDEGEAEEAPVVVKTAAPIVKEIVEVVEYEEVEIEEGDEQEGDETVVDEQEAQ